MSNILATLHRADGVDVHGKTIERTAVRAVIQRGENLLMILSANVGDYKFPGGGIHAGETHEDALRREVCEECGAELSCIGEEIGAVIEYNPPAGAPSGPLRKSNFLSVNFGSLSGMSGCSAYAQREGDTKWSLAGIVYEASDTEHATIFVTHANFVRSTGQLDRNRMPW